MSAEWKFALFNIVIFFLIHSLNIPHSNQSLMKVNHFFLYNAQYQSPQNSQLGDISPYTLVSGEVVTQK